MRTVYLPGFPANSEKQVPPQSVRRGRDIADDERQGNAIFLDGLFSTRPRLIVTLSPRCDGDIFIS
jgi:hypothetical protein